MLIVEFRECIVTNTIYYEVSARLEIWPFYSLCAGLSMKIEMSLEEWDGSVSGK